MNRMRTVEQHDFQRFRLTSFVYFSESVEEDASFTSLQFRDYDTPATVRTYTRIPIHAEGFELKSSGAIARPTITLANISSTFSNAVGTFEYNILLGTQMIAKGLDFNNVTFVGIVNADVGLFLPDFRAGEKIFQLIYQVAGRSGRRKKQGKVFIQTYNSDDIYIKTASHLDLEKFYNIALHQRKE